jgi:hypothetical protein
MSPSPLFQYPEAPVRVGLFVIVGQDVRLAHLSVGKAERLVHLSLEAHPHQVQTGIPFLWNWSIDITENRLRREHCDLLEDQLVTIM